MRVGIIGAGHAGVKAAEVLSGAGAEVVLFSNETMLPYYRPRVISLAFGQAELDQIIMHPQAFYDEKGIELRLGTEVTAIDASAKSVSFDGKTEQFDELILAMGAGPFVPPITNEPISCVLPLWSADDAMKIRALARDGSALTIIGGGILGIEAALRAVEAGVQVTVIERLPRLLPMQFGETASSLLQSVLEKRGIKVLIDCSVSSVEKDAAGVVVKTECGENIKADCVVISVGARRNVAIAKDAGLAAERGISVDSCLRTSVEDVWGAGDLIEMEGLNRCSALDASMQGRLAANNLLNADGELEEYKPSDAAVNFKLKDFEIHSVGRVASEGDREEVLDSDDKSCRIQVFSGEQLVGIQMIGTNEDFKTMSALLQ